MNQTTESNTKTNTIRRSVSLLVPVMPSVFFVPWRGNTMTTTVEATKTITLYHGTSSRFLKQIQRDGIQPRGITGKSVYEDELISDAERVYLTDTYAAQFGALAVRKYGGQVLICKVDVPADELLADTDFADCDGQQSLQHAGTCSIARGVMPTRMWVVSKNNYRMVFDDFEEPKVYAGMRHAGCGKGVRQAMQDLLCLGNRHVLRDGEWVEM
ncbi:MAG TPA: hypothetical protein VHP11_09985 [Tepidisphaeraceae bacterium]|nr:hypothetical protein [Tepidisphaeraceae bacterium]